MSFFLQFYLLAPVNMFVYGKEKCKGYGDCKEYSRNPVPWGDDPTGEKTKYTDQYNGGPDGVRGCGK